MDPSVSLWMILLFFPIIMLIVTVHELGHYWVGKAVGIQPLSFSVGIGPTLYSRTDREGVVWKLCLLPIGGYVSFLGDSVLGNEDPNAETPGSMQRSSTLGRCLMFMAGPGANVLLSVVLFSILFYATPQTADPLEVSHVSAPALKALSAGELGSGTPDTVAKGDQVLSIQRSPVRDPDEIAQAAYSNRTEQTLTYRVMRDGIQFSVEGPNPYPALIGQVEPLGAADLGGLQAGDLVKEVNGTPVFSFVEIVAAVRASDGNSIDLTIFRNDTLVTLSVQPTGQQTDQGIVYRIGANAAPFLEFKQERAGLANSLFGGVESTVAIVDLSVKGVLSLFSNEFGACSLSGPLAIAKLTGKAASMGWLVVLHFMAALSIVVAVMNLIPLPVLDGGRIVLLGYEAVCGSAPSPKVFRALMNGGLAIILSLMAFAFITDLYC